MDGKLLARARERLEERKRHNEQVQQEHRRAAYARVPELKSVDAELRGLVARAAVNAIRHGEDVFNAIDALAQKSLALQERRRALLRNAGLPETYMDEIYTCPLCQDSGYRGGEMCECLKGLYREEARAALPALLRAQEADFARFDLSYYPEQTLPDAGVSPRERMRVVRDFCRLYAQKFAPGADDLLLQGGAGLGKTFLAACIARTAAENGFAVAYETAVACIADFETQKYGRGSEEYDGACARVRRYLDCDLMILDDLGTETAGGFSLTALYTLVNTRLTNGKTTVICTNLTDEELHRRYSAQLMSRIEGEYVPIRFLGNDIRKMRVSRGRGQ